MSFRLLFASRDLLILIGDDEKSVEAKTHQGIVELSGHVLALVDHEERRPQRLIVRHCVHDLFHARPVDFLVSAVVRLLHRNGLSRKLPKDAPEPTVPGPADKAASEQLVAGPVEEVVEDQEQEVVAILLVAPGANQREHGLSRSRPSHDEMLAFLGAGRALPPAPC